MSREILVKISLEFEPKDKHEVENLIKEKFGGDENILIVREDYISFDLFNYNLTEGDFDDFKEICNLIIKTEFEIYDEGCFIWEKSNCEHSFIDENNDNKSICRFCGVEE